MNKKRRCRKRHSVIDNTAITGDENSLFRNEGMKRECALHPSRSLSETQPFTVACDTRCVGVHQYHGIRDEQTDKKWERERDKKRERGSKRGDQKQESRSGRLGLMAYKNCTGGINQCHFEWRRRLFSVSREPENSGVSSICLSFMNFMRRCGEQQPQPPGVIYALLRRLRRSTIHL